MSFKTAAGAKRKGDRFERECVNRLRDAQHEAHRVPLSGAVSGYEGDIYIIDPRFPKQRIVVQCKVRGTGAGYARVPTLMRGMDIAWCLGPRGTIPEGPATFVCTWEFFLRVMARTAIFPTIYPQVPLYTAAMRDALNGHHVLFMKKDRGVTWVFFDEHFLRNIVSKPQCGPSSSLGSNVEGTLK